MSLRITFPWNEQTYVQSGMIANRYKMRYSWKQVIGYAFIGVALYGTLKAIDRQDYSLLYLGIIFSIYWYFLRPILHRQRLKAFFKKEPAKNMTMEFVFNAHGVRINGNMIPWSHISRVIVSSSGFLLERPEGYPYIPATAFERDEDVETFLALVEKQGIDVRRV